MRKSEADRRELNSLHLKPPLQAFGAAAKAEGDFRGQSLGECGNVFKELQSLEAAALYCASASPAIFGICRENPPGPLLSAARAADEPVEPRHVSLDQGCGKPFENLFGDWLGPGAKGKRKEFPLDVQEPACVGAKVMPENKTKQPNASALSAQPSGKTRNRN